MRNTSTMFGLIGFLLVAVSACSTDHGHASRSSDDVNICRQFVAEACNTMQELKRDTFHPRDLTFDLLQILTPTDPDFVQAEFLVLNQEWSFQKDGKRIVIVCAQARIEQGHRKYFAAFDSGDYGWVGEAEVAKLRLADYIALPKIR
jgi:hypothetical protein